MFITDNITDVWGNGDSKDTGRWGLTWRRQDQSRDETRR